MKLYAENESLLLWLTGAGCAIVLCGAYIFILRRKVADLARTVAQKKDALSRTTKLLVEKNLELFDKNTQQQKQLESKSDFIEIVSHQLRTPATEIKWGVETIEEEFASTIDPTLMTYVQKLHSSAARMVRLIDNLVRLMNIEEGYNHLYIEPYEPDNVVRAVAQRVASLFPASELSLNLDANGPTSSMDCESLDMVVSNLVDNAFHYTPPGGLVTVTTTHLPDGGFKCAVTDTGVGIPADKQKTIFVKFQRSETAMRMNSGGMGLGLYLVKNIVERYGGTVGFSSEKENGSSFFFTLPRERSSAT